MESGDGLWSVLLAICNIIIIYHLVVAKFSFARLREEHVEEMEDLSEKKRQFLLHLYKKPDKFLNTTQFLIVCFILLLANTSTYVLDEWVQWIMNYLGWTQHWLFTFIDATILLLISMVVLLFGEIVPKALGLSFPERYIYWHCKIIVNISPIIYPFVGIAMCIGNTLLKPFHTKYSNELDLVHSEEELRMMVSRSHQEGEIDHVESELIDNVFDFVDRMAKEVMIPRQDVDVVYVEEGYDEAVKTIRSTAHTRYPLCLEDKDHIIGLVHIKDLMERPEQARRDLRNIKREILTVPEVMKLSTLLQYMRTRRIYLAVVVDEYGGMVGLVGLEDIIEELVGDIQDEHETKLPSTMVYSDGSFAFDGTVLVDDVEDIMDIDLDDADSDTIGGYVFGLLERTPIVGDTVTVQGYEFIVTQMRGYRIARIKAVPLPTPETEPDDEHEQD